MNIFKNLSLLSLLLIPSYFINAQPIEVYINDINFEEEYYSSGEVLKGNFNLYNLTNRDYFDLKYVLSLRDAETDEIIDVINNKDLISVYQGEETNVSFRYNIPFIPLVFNNIKLHIEIYSSENQYLSENEINLNLKEQISKEIILNKVSFLDKDDGFNAVARGEDLSFIIEIAKTNKVERLQSEINIYKEYLGGDIVNSLPQENISTKTTEDTKHLFRVPTDLPEGDYIATFFLENDDRVSILKTLKYYIYEETVSITDVYTNKLSPIKGESFVTSIDYLWTGMIDINTELIGDLSVVIKNNFGGVIEEWEGEVDLKKTSIKIPITPENNISNLNYEISFSKDGKNLITYEKSFPKESTSEEKKSESKLVYLFWVLVALFIVFEIIYLKRKNKKIFSLFLICVATFFIHQSVDAATIEYEKTTHEYDGNFKTQYREKPFELRSVTPLPPESGRLFYAGGDISLNAIAKWDVNYWNDKQTNVEIYGFSEENWETLDYSTMPELKNLSWWKDNGIVHKNPLNIEPTVYKAPTTPGIYKLYFYIDAKGSAKFRDDLATAEGRVHTKMLVSQEIKVIPHPINSCGFGFIFDESTGYCEENPEFGICPQVYYINFDRHLDPSLYGTYIGEDTPLAITPIGAYDVVSEEWRADKEYLGGDVIFKKTTEGGGDDLKIFQGFTSIYNELSYNDFDGPSASLIALPKMGDKLTISWPNDVYNISHGLVMSSNMSFIYSHEKAEQDGKYRSETLEAYVDPLYWSDKPQRTTVPALWSIQWHQDEACPPPADVCPRLEGDQPTVPEGYEIDENGFCSIINCNSDHSEGDLTCIDNIEYSWVCSENTVSGGRVNTRSSGHMMFFEDADGTIYKVNSSGDKVPYQYTASVNWAFYNQTLEANYDFDDNHWAGYGPTKFYQDYPNFSGELPIKYHKTNIFTSELKNVDESICSAFEYKTSLKEPLSIAENNNLPLCSSIGIEPINNTSAYGYCDSQYNGVKCRSDDNWTNQVWTDVIQCKCGVDTKIPDLVINEWETVPTGNSCGSTCNSDHSEGDSAGESDCGELLWKCLNGTWGKVDNNGNKCVPTCNNDHDEGDLTCINNNEYSYTCNTGSWDTVPTGETCNDTGGGGGSCPILPTNVGSATYNIFDKAGNFVLTDPVPGDDKTTVDIFNQYFKSDILAEILVYNENNGDESDIQLETSFGDPIIKSLNPALPYGQAIQGSTNDTCSTSICPLSSGDAVYSNNEACTLEKEGENIITNGCYDLGGNNSLKLLTSPNFMNPGEYCTISWCAQGPDAQSCILVVDEETIGTGLSGTTSYQMGEQSEQVMLSCNNGAGGGEIQKIDNCRLHPDWNEF